MSKTVNGATTKYYYDDAGRLYHIGQGDNTLWLYYGPSGTATSFRYNGAQYYYIKSIQGDVVALVDASGNIVARYIYDVWGKILAITDADGNDISTNATHIANINPLRYRSYMYDAESGFYYLTSRYYDPTVGRFINLDGYVSTGQGLIGYNMYAYCNNDPVNYLDLSGSRPLHRSPMLMFNDGILILPETKEKGIWGAIAESISGGYEVGSGIGINTNIGGFDIEAEYIFIATEWKSDGYGNKQSVDKHGINVSAEVVENVGVGFGYTYSAPTETTKDYGLAFAPDASTEWEVGAYAYDATLGWSNSARESDIVLSFGLSAYLFLGGGFELNFNLTKFIEYWEAP